VLLGVLMALILVAQRWLLPRLFLLFIGAPLLSSPSRATMHHAIATVCGPLFYDEEFSFCLM